MEDTKSESTPQMANLCAGESSTMSYKVLQHLLTAKRISIDDIEEACKKVSPTHEAPCKDTKQSSKEESKKNQPKKPTVEPRRRHIALEIWYDGRNYTGLAENVGRDDDRSVERTLFTALKRAKLVENRINCSYSRSGRTDKGVSAAGQVVALKIRSAIAPNASLVPPPNEAPISDHDLPSDSSQKVLLWSPNLKKPNEPWKQKEVAEYPYDKILNNLLPEDIRVLGWAPVSESFSARFSTTMRTYRYFFHPSGMDLSRINDALGRFEGTHDFRNYCKMNVDEVSNFTRTIHKASLIQTHDAHMFQIQGNAFLWHQIRCIVAILFLVGQGLEEPSIVSELFDIEKYPGKPAYSLADEAPLVLHECQYKQMKLNYSVSNLWEVCRCLHRQKGKLLIATAQIENCLRKLRDANVATDDVCSFFESKVERRRQKNPNFEAETQMEGRPIPDDTMSWQVALEWFESKGFRLDQAAEQSHTPVLQRSKGTTYEEKVASRLEGSSQRRSRFVENRQKKQKISKDEDKQFHEAMRNTI